MGHRREILVPAASGLPRRQAATAEPLLKFVSRIRRDEDEADETGGPRRSASGRHVARLPSGGDVVQLDGAIAEAAGAVDLDLDAANLDPRLA
jgi:hypothetical protein